MANPRGKCTYSLNSDNCTDSYKSKRASCRAIYMESIRATAVREWEGSVDALRNLAQGMANPNGTRCCPNGENGCRCGAQKVILGSYWNDGKCEGRTDEVGLNQTLDGDSDSGQRRRRRRHNDKAQCMEVPDGCLVRASYGKEWYPGHFPYG